MSFFAMGLLGFLLVLLWPGDRWNRTLILLPVILLPRLILLATAPSDDIHRYLWEGKLTAAGVSPYAQLADDPAREEFRDEHWKRMNHRDKPTAYPPLAQFVFAAVATASYHPLAFKVIFLVAEMAAILGLLALLRWRGLPAHLSLLYALSPLAMVSFAAEGHFDSLMLAAIVWSLFFADHRRPRWAMACLALAAGFKFVALVLAPFLLLWALRGRSGLRTLLRDGALASGICLGLFALPFVSFQGETLAVFQALQEFALTGAFNGPIYDLIYRAMGLGRSFASQITTLAFAFVLIWRFFWHHRAPADRQIRWVLGALLLFSPIIHFWYLCWLLPFIALRPNAGWLGLSLSSAAYFFVWENAQLTGWRLLPWQEVLFWSPLAIGLTYDLVSQRFRPLRRAPRPLSDEPHFAIIIPCLDTDQGLPDCLDSLRNQVEPIEQIILPWAGDNPPEFLSRDAATSHTDLPSPLLIRSQRGRGNQIHTGLQSVTAPWCLVLHADSRLAPQALRRLRRAIAADPELVGGALGQRFEPESWHTLPIEVLNEVRASLARTSFGDQTQFFRSDLARTHELIPPQPLMEDVEASWRIRELGPSLFLGCPTRSSSAKWQPATWWRRVRLVISLVAQYRLARLKSRRHAAELSHSLYQRYYAVKLDHKS